MSDCACCTGVAAARLVGCVERACVSLRAQAGVRGVVQMLGVGMQSTTVWLCFVHGAVVAVRIRLVLSGAACRLGSPANVFVLLSFVLCTRGELHIYPLLSPTKMSFVSYVALRLVLPACW